MFNRTLFLMFASLFFLNVNAQKDQSPNFLIICSDQHSPKFSSIYGHPQIKTPYLDSLAKTGIVFENAYTPSPICVPSRMSFITGKFVQNIGVWDNGVPLPEDQPTIAHVLRKQGYNVALSGKVHFRGHDQLHGFEKQLAIDMNAMNYPVPIDWTEKPKVPKSSKETMGAGPGENAVILSDNLVTERAIEYLNNKERKAKPWALMVGLVSPHPPFKVPEKYYRLYPEESVEMPVIPDGHLERLHPANKRHRMGYGYKENDMLPEDVIRKVRATYFGMITYMDAKIGELISTLRETNQLDNTVIIYFSDHGEMLGEHGMWAKTNLYEESVRIPIVVSYPKKLLSGHRVEKLVNAVDLSKTILSLAGTVFQELPFTLDGRDLSPLMTTKDAKWTNNSVISEYYANHSIAPMAMYRRDDYKLHYYHNEQPELYDLSIDPNEMDNLAEAPLYKHITSELTDELLRVWNPKVIEGKVLKSQQTRKYLDPFLFRYIQEERSKWPIEFTENLNSKRN